MTDTTMINVMVVEDEPRMRELLLRMLHELGFDGTGYATAEQARRAMDECSEPTVLILDLNLPGISGLELYEQLRQERDDIAAIVLTGFGSLESAQQAIRLDAVDFLTKPCHLGELERAVVRAAARLRQPQSSVDAEVAEESPSPASDPRTIDELEHSHILAALERHGGNRKAAADELGISLRTLYYRLKRYRGE